jgi:hypothetical protein
MLGEYKFAGQKKFMIGTFRPMPSFFHRCAGIGPIAVISFSVKIIAKAVGKR